MEKTDKIEAHLAKMNLDIRGTREARARTRMTPRFMDQKCTPDVLASSANWILSLPEEVQDRGFTKRTIWDSPAFERDLRVEFSKPGVDEETASNEYDKVISQPLKTLDFAGLLSSKKVGNEIHFSVKNRELLEFISLGPRNSRIFLCTYLRHVLMQSGIYYRFEAFFESNHTNDDYLDLRDSFDRFILNQTFITGTTEIHRIFAKVLNPLSHQLGLPGSKDGRVTTEPIMFSSLLYNNVNFRDKGRKPKGSTRRQAKIADKNAKLISKENIRRAMDSIRSRHNGQSEVNDRWSVGQATQVHHIFPQSSHPGLVDIRENLILLTPTQHNTLAHPLNNTNAVDFDYQIECLLSKLSTIEKSIQSNPDDDFYSLKRLISVINTGYIDIGIPINSTFNEVRLMLRSYYDAGGTKAIGTPISPPEPNLYRVPGSDGREFLTKDLE